MIDLDSIMFPEAKEITEQDLEDTLNAHIEVRETLIKAMNGTKNEQVKEELFRLVNDNDTYISYIESSLGCRDLDVEDTEANRLLLALGFSGYKETFSKVWIEKGNKFQSVLTIIFSPQDVSYTIERYDETDHGLIARKEVVIDDDLSYVLGLKMDEFRDNE